MVKIAVMGYGVVGSGVVEVIYKNYSTISENARQSIDVKYILDIKDYSDSPYSEKFIKDFSIIEKDPEISVVVETIGGLNPAYDFVKRALLAGKNIVTSNKELVAEHGAELIRIASERNLNFLFEASVGGGIPIIRPITQCLNANEIIEITGILNGTTNYILTKMIKENQSFNDALSDAQGKGYAERNPSADIDGHDACRKICILAALAYGKHIYPKFVHTEGISGITLDDVDSAQKAGKVIKLLGRAIKTKEGEVYIIVAPHLVNGECPLSKVDGVYNGIIVNGNVLGEVMFYGQGAGKLPTASAVVADVIDASKHITARKHLDWEDSDGSFVYDFSQWETSFMVRCESEVARKLYDIYGRYKTIQVKGGISSIITPKLKEAQHLEIFEKAGGIISAIRIYN